MKRSLKKNNQKKYHPKLRQMKFLMKMANSAIPRSLARLTSMTSLLTVMMEGQAIIKTMMMKRKEKKKKRKWEEKKMSMKKMKRTMQTRLQMKILLQTLWTNEMLLSKTFSLRKILE